MSKLTIFVRLRQLIKRHIVWWTLLPAAACGAASDAEHCLKVFADQARLRQESDSVGGRKWVRSHIRDLTFSVNSTLMDVEQLRNPQLPILLRRYAFSGYGGKPWIRLEMPGRSVSLQMERDYYDLEDSQRADYPVSEAKIHLLATAKGVYLLARNPTWEGRESGNAISIYKWLRGSFVYVDSAPIELDYSCGEACAGKFWSADIGFIDVWAVNRTGHVFVSDMAMRVSLIFKPTGKYWGRLLVGGRAMLTTGQQTDGGDAFPILCIGAGRLSVRGAGLAKIVDGQRVETASYILIDNK